jgi:hypothetical protein
VETLNQVLLLLKVPHVPVSFLTHPLLHGFPLLLKLLTETRIHLQFLLVEFQPALFPVRVFLTQFFQLVLFLDDS